MVVVRDGARRSRALQHRTIRSPRRFAAVFLLWCFMPATWAFMGHGILLSRRLDCWITRRWVLSSWAKGPQRSQVEAAARGVGKIKFLPFRPPEQVPYVLAAGDLHLVTIKRGLEGVVVPSKLYSILAAGRPFLALAPEGSDAARVVRRVGCGVVVDPDDPAALAAAVRKLTHDRERLARMGERALQAAVDYEREKELQHFRQVVEGVPLTLPLRRLKN